MADYAADSLPPKRGHSCASFHNNIYKLLGYYTEARCKCASPLGRRLAGAPAHDTPPH